MKRIQETEERLFGSAVSGTDSNRFYSILLDARSSTTSENMYDVAEKLLHSEKENSKLSLEKLWSLKKNMQGDTGVGTIDLLIQFYQDKIDILRNKEEHIKQISKDSRKLLEEKRKKDSEIATVKQELTDCTKAMTELKIKSEQLTIREQELALIEMQLKKELQVNESEIINGLYEIILSQQQGTQDETALDKGITQQAESLLSPVPAPEQSTNKAPVPQSEPKSGAGESLEASIDDLRREDAEPVLEKVQASSDRPDLPEPSADLFKKTDVPKTAPFPKSVVKTTRGRVIGEYYYDAKVYKNKRHYIYNSKFFLEQLTIGLEVLRHQFDQAAYSDVLQMVQDSYKRIVDNANLHFEISTNEMLNEKTMKELWQNLKIKSYDEVERFCNRLKAKIEVLGNNYHTLLSGQMERLVKN